MMKLKNPLLAVSDLEKSKAFYKDVLGLRVIMDYGANVTLTGGLSLQTKESWLTFIQQDETALVFGGNASEIYFEEDDFDGFVQKLDQLPGIQYVHPVFEHRWGQRVVRFYDPDHHIIEVGENLHAVFRRFLDSGMAVAEVAQRMEVPERLVRSAMK